MPRWPKKVDPVVENKKLKAIVARTDKILAFYGEREYWKDTIVDVVGRGTHSKAEADGGRRARKELRLRNA